MMVISLIRLLRASVWKYDVPREQEVGKKEDEDGMKCVVIQRREIRHRWSWIEHHPDKCCCWKILHLFSVDDDDLLTKLL